jgi:ABC-2 type transport system permease protein
MLSYNKRRITPGWLTGFFRIRFINSLQYRAAAWAGVVTQFAWGFMTIFSFAAFYRESPDTFPMTFRQTVTYLWLQQGLLAIFYVWFWDGDIASSIESGSIAYELVRPVDLYNRWACQIAANRLASVLLRCTPLFAVAFLIPAPYRMTLPAGWTQAVLFILSSALAFGVVIAISLLIYISLFYTISPLGVRIIVSTLSEFLSGAIIPLPFFPEPVRVVAELLPFASLQNVPLRIYTGDMTGAETARAVALQVFWLAALWVAGRVIMRRALKKVIVQGG